MRERLQQRLAELRTQFLEGQKTIADFESKLTSVRTTVLRISGAIQVLEEELAIPDTDRVVADLEGKGDLAESRKIA